MSHPGQPRSGGLVPARPAEIIFEGGGGWVLMMSGLLEGAAALSGDFKVVMIAWALSSLETVSSKS